MNNSQVEVEDVKIKVVFGKDIRRWHCPEKNRYNELMSFVAKTFQLKTPQEFQIQYEDLEMDHITLSNEQDFEDALTCALEQDRKSLKLYVVKKNREQDENVQVDKKEKEDSKVENADRCGSEASSHQNDGNCRKIALEFLLNEEIKKLLPELARDVVRAMHGSNNVGGAALLEVVQVLLSEDKYAPIVCHEFYQNRIRNQMPIWLTKIAPFSTMLLNLNEEGVVLMVSNAINALTLSMASENNCQGNTQMWNPLSLLMGGLQQGAGCGWGPAWGSFCGTGQEEVIHQHVQCDGCGVQPIRGVRYKCTECPNYDLCSKCEAAKKHPNHPLAKIERSEPMNFGHCGRNRRTCKREYKTQVEWIKEVNNEPIYGVVKSVLAKTWEVKNTGEEEWGENIELVFIRGNKTLPLETRYRVPQAKPQETVQLTAAIQVPNVPGRYLAYFRLQENGRQFGPRLCVEVFALADNEREEDKKEESKPVENKPIENKSPEPQVETKPVENAVEDDKPTESKIVVRCICGEAMVETTPIAAYFENAEVNCDMCGETCLENTLIYHCYSETNHPKGYDICLDCAYNQESLEPAIQKKEEPKQPKKEEPIQSKEVQTSPVVNNPFAGFQYEKEARDIMEMGFNDVLVIKELLVRLKGNVNEALGELIQIQQ